MKKTIQLPSGHSLRYYTNGSGKNIPILLLHGFCESSRVWTDTLPFLKNKKVIRIDLPGFGGSDAMKHSTVESYADAVNRVLIAEEISRCLLLGHSLGGYVALAFAEKYPAALVGLGLIHSHPFEDSVAKKEERFRAVALLQKGGKRAYLRLLFAGLFTPTFIKDNETILKVLVQKAEQGSTFGIQEALRAMAARPDRSTILAGLSVPVFMALGEEDALLPPVRSNTMLTMPKQADVQVWADVAHMSMYECPEKLGHAISNFHIFAAQMHAT